MDKGYYLEVAESDYHLRELIDFLSFPMTGKLYTYYPYAGERYTHVGRVLDITNYRAIGENPFYNFWSVTDFHQVLEKAVLNGKTAIVLENEFPYETRTVLEKIIAATPHTRIEPITDRDEHIIGFQCLLQSDIQ